VVKLTRNKLTQIFVSTLVVALVFAAGCSQSPTSNLDQPTEPRVLQRSLPSGSAQLGSANLSVAETISAEKGGVLTCLDVILEVPPGAVDTASLFSIDIPDINVFFNEFGTHGMVFNVPVKVTMSYRDADLSGIDEKTIRIAWLNETSGELEDMECEVDFVNKTVTGYLDHFSAYGLISD